jgi:hypothetical protein
MFRRLPLFNDRILAISILLSVYPLLPLTMSDQDATEDSPRSRSYLDMIDNSSKVQKRLVQCSVVGGNWL